VLWCGRANLIITSHLAWVHLPKTAGTTTDALFEASGLKLYWRDDQSSPRKHLPPHDHPALPELPLVGRQLISNFRRLPYWLLSNHQHKRIGMELDIAEEPMRRGLFYRHREQAWLPADWWLDRFGIDESWLLLRCEHLKRDFLSTVGKRESLGLRAALHVLRVPVYNRRAYERRLSDWFDASDLEVIYRSNPRWASLEERVYGRLLLRS